MGATWPPSAFATAVAVHAETAAGSLAAVGLALLRTDVPRMSVRDERQMRYASTASAVAALLDRRDAQQVEMLATELPGRLAGPAGAQAAEQAVDEALHPPRSVDRAVRLLAAEHDVDAHADGEATVVIEEPLASVPEPMMIIALRLANETGPVFARGETSEGRPVLAVWCSPWLAVERVGKTGLRFGRAWRLGQGQNLYGIGLLTELPRADLWWSPGEPRPGDLRELLAMADDDWPENEADGPP